MPNFPKHMNMLPYRGEVRRQFDMENDTIKVAGFDGNEWITLGGVTHHHTVLYPHEAEKHLHKLELDFKESLHHGKHRQPNQTNNSDPSEAPGSGTPGASTASTAGTDPGASSGKSLTVQVATLAQMLGGFSSSRQQGKSQYNAYIAAMQAMSAQQQQKQHYQILAQAVSGAGGPGGFLQLPDIAPEPVIPHEGIQLGEIEAYRAWFLINGKLRSMYKKTFWEPGQPMTGDVSDGGGVHAWNSHDGTMIYVMEEANLNWNAEQTEQLAYKAYFPRTSKYEPLINERPATVPPVIIGKLVLWGEVVHHKLGYRAEFARPTEFLQVLDVSRRGKHWDHDRSHDILSQLHSTYLTPPTE